MTPTTATLLLVTYQQEAYVGEAVRSALSQTYSPLEIFISDDCSSDATWDIVRQECANYDGPHRLVLNRNPERLYLRHWSTILPRLSGQRVILGCGDDVFEPHRVSAVMDAFHDSGATVLGSNCWSMADNGEILGLFRDPKADYDVSLDAFFDNYFTVMCHGATLAWDRAITDVFGPLPVMRNIDWIIPFRGLLLGGNHYLREPLLRYRTHDGNTALGLKLIGLEEGLERQRIVEAQQCQRIVNNLYMHDDVATLRRVNPGHPRLDYLEAAMARRLSGDLRTWAELRTDWVQQGIGP